MRKASRLTSMDNVLNGVARDLKFEDRMEQIMLYRLWCEAVGEQIARNATPALVRGGVLQVNVSSPVWVQQLQFLRDSLLEKINAGLSGQKIRDIRFKIGPVSAPPSGAADPAAPLPELDEKEKLHAEAEAEKIADPEIREAFREFMTTYLKARKATE